MSHVQSQKYLHASILTVYFNTSLVCFKKDTRSFFGLFCFCNVFFQINGKKTSKIHIYVFILLYFDYLCLSITILIFKYQKSPLHSTCTQQTLYILNPVYKKPLISPKKKNNQEYWSWLYPIFRFLICHWFYKSIKPVWSVFYTNCTMFYGCLGT